MITIKTIEQLTDDILNAKANELGVDVSDLGETIIVESKSLAAVLYPIYLTMAQVQNNQYPDLADEDMLRRWGYAVLRRYPSPATQGVYVATVTGTAGQTITSGTTFMADDDTLTAGTLFVLDTDFTFSGSSGSITLRALQSGSSYLLYVGDTLTNQKPNALIGDKATITSVTTIPANAEDIESYRIDVLEGIRVQSQGMSAGDMRLWALDVPEVRTIYPYLKSGYQGDIDVFIEATEENTKTGELIGTPTDDTIDAIYKVDYGTETGAMVYDEVEQKGRKVIGVLNIYPKSVVHVPVDIYFIGLSDLGLRDSIFDAIESELYNIRPFISGGQSINDKNDTVYADIIRSVIITTLSGTGESYTSVSIKVNGNTVDSYKCDNGIIPYLRDIYNNGNDI